MERGEMLDSREFHDDLAADNEISDIAGPGLIMVMADRRADLLTVWANGLARLVI
jgi:hypothetical protein